MNLPPFPFFLVVPAQIMGSAADGDLLHDRHPVHGGSWQDLWYPPLHHLLKGQAGLFLHCLVTVFQLELAHISALLKRKISNSAKVSRLSNTE